MSAWVSGAGRLAASGLLGGKPPERECQWVALAALFGGVFIKPQYEAWGAGGRMSSHRLVERLERAKLAREVDGGGGIGRYIHLYSRRLYAELGMGDSRYRRKPAPGHLLQRLLCVDYLLEHADLGWVPGGHEPAAFQALGAPDDALPRRVYAARNGGPPAVAYFPARWPVAVSEGEACFVFPDSGETGRPARDLRTWGAHHGALWSWLLGRGVEVSAVFVSRNIQRERGVRPELQLWAGSGVPYRDAGAADPRVGRLAGEIAEIEAAVKGGDAEAVARWGDVLAAVRRRNALRQTLRELEEPSPAQRSSARVPRPGTWVSWRLEARAKVEFGAEEPVDLEVRRLPGVEVPR